jgi:hypothetical protein
LSTALPPGHISKTKNPIISSTSTSIIKKIRTTTTETPVIVDRNIFNAPDKCFEGFGFAMGRCRKIYDNINF